MIARHSPFARALCRALLAACAASPGLAHAAGNPAYDVLTFRPTPHPELALGAPASAVPGHLRLQTGAYLGYHHMAAKVTDQASGAQVALLRRQLTLDVLASVGLLDRVSVGVAVPLVLAQGDALPAELGLRSIDGKALGDLRVGLRGRVLGDGVAGVGVALEVEASLPTSTATVLAGDGGVGVAGRAVVDFRTGPIAVGVALGYRKRAGATVLAQPFGDDLQAAASASYAVLPGLLDAVGALQGWTAATAPLEAQATTGAEGLIGARLRVLGGSVTAAVGGNLGGGFGSPALRAVLGVEGQFGAAAAKAPAPAPFACPDHPEVREPARCKDADGDGLLDGDDGCPQAAGAPALRGCPDGDGDGVADPSDRCPTASGKAEVGGCPDQDGDAVADGDDACVALAGQASAKGCPDGDADGVADSTDKCPQVAGKGSATGCPTDRDGDGLADDVDACPDAAGPGERKGCPAERVAIGGERLVIADKVYFDAGSANIQPRSHGLLNEVAKLLRKHAEVKRVRIEGHTDDQGNAESNKRLAQLRAESVKIWLVDKGVAAARLAAVGVGAERPVADNAEEAGRAHNRRVEFHIEVRE